MKKRVLTVPFLNFRGVSSEKAKELNADVVGSSAMMTTTQIGQKKLEDALKKAGLRDKVLTMVGGVVATDHWAQRIGSDFFGETPQDTIMKLEQSLKQVCRGLKFQGYRIQS